MLTNKEAIKALRDIAKYYSYITPNDNLTALKMAIDALSADAAEVVRCKDCLMTKERDEYTNKVWCCRHREYMDDTYYCADGLREDGEA